MGDKGGKKDKEKHKKQNNEKQKQKSKDKLDKQPKRNLKVGIHINPRVYPPST